MGSNKSSSSKLKDRLARMFRPASLLRSSCNPSTSSASSAAAAAMSSANTSSRALLADVAHNPVFVPTPAPSIATVTISVALYLPPPLIVKNAKRSNSSACKNTKVERRVRENGGFYETGGVAEGRTCPPVSPSSPSKSFSASRNYCYYNHHRCFNEAKLEDLTKKKTNKKTKKKKKLLLTNSYGFTSSSSIESDDGYAFFSSEEEEGEAGKREEETETFFSSKSFSSDSSEFYRRPLPKHRSNTNTKEKEKKRRGRQRIRSRSVGSSCNSCNVKEGFRPLVSVAAASKEAKKKKGFAVVKRSSDPYADFRTSMVEMIVERQIFAADDLERLLQSYLSLNSPRHHPVILQAFSDIWVALFGN
uniref:Transcription repressor n=1 Tax=Ananas comosus var. bracteatus TaxID=296719 RepID=A0A6V7QK87_ANACO|nr:unnamed protein product [Ananas comosus var. bracteatus]